MDRFSESLNDLMTETFASILKTEENSLRDDCSGRLSISEWHLIVCVGKGGSGGRTISEISKDLSIAPPSVTVAINKLADKGLVEKLKGSSDGRMVYAKLTADGRRMEISHKAFHRGLVDAVCNGLTDDDKVHLYDAINKIKVFFDDKNK